MPKPTDTTEYMKTKDPVKLTSKQDAAMDGMSLLFADATLSEDKPSLAQSVVLLTGLVAHASSTLHAIKVFKHLRDGKSFASCVIASLATAMDINLHTVADKMAETKYHTPKRDTTGLN